MSLTKKFIFTVSKQQNIFWASQHITSDLFTSFDVVSDKEIPNGFPQIIQNPGMKVVEKGRNTVLVCEAGGDPKPTITWIKVKKEISICIQIFSIHNIYFRHFRTQCQWFLAPVMETLPESPCCSKVNWEVRQDGGHLIWEISVLDQISHNLATIVGNPN